MYSIKISSPALTSHGKVARNRKYTVTMSFNGTMSTLTLQQYCERHGITLMALVRHLKNVPDGVYDKLLREIVEKMKTRLRGKYAHHGRKTLCPHCGKLFHRSDAVFARRRAKRDASAMNSVWRLRPPEYYGEPATPAGNPAATVQAVSQSSPHPSGGEALA